jgi:hypothetical protein
MNASADILRDSRGGFTAFRRCARSWQRWPRGATICGKPGARGVGGTAVPQLISVADAIATEPRPLTRKSAGLAWLMSLAVPGAGHFYVGLWVRGLLLLLPSIAGWALLVVGLRSGGEASQAVVGTFLMMLPLLWVFGFFDAYLTVVERNRGIDPALVDNPRVAAMLNLLTSGFGYFYLGERTKGVVVFVVFGLLRRVEAVLQGPGGTLLSTALLAAAVYLATDAYRLGRRSFDAQIASMDLPATPPPSRVPPAVPIAAAALVLLALALFLAAGFLMSALVPDGG